MLKLFVAFIFAVFAFNCDRIIEVVATGNDNVETTTSNSTKSSTHEPLIVIVKEKQANTTFPIPYFGIIPFHKVQILSEQQSNDEFNRNKDKMYFCPHETWLHEMNIWITEDYSLNTLFEKRFNEGEVHRCSSKPWYVSINRQYPPTNCHHTQGLYFGSVGIAIGNPTIKEKIPETGKEESIYYKEGMDKFIQLQKPNDGIVTQLIEMYQLCYDNDTERTKWIIREITPWAQLDRVPEQQEKIYTPDVNKKSETIYQQIVPAEENSFLIWQHATTYKYNHAIIHLKLKPLFDLINERFEKYSKQFNRWITVMTRLIEYENVNVPQKPDQKEKSEEYRPELLIIQAYDEVIKSAITFVMHNTKNPPSVENKHCKKSAKCDFMQWIEGSSVFKKYINDDLIRFAYCCETTNDEFPMLLDIEIKKVMEINWNSTSSHAT